MPGHGTRQRGSLPSAKNKALGKEGFEFFLKKISLCRVPPQEHLAKKLKKIKSLPSAVPGALGKVFLKKFKKIFTECHASGTRQSIFQKTNLPSAYLGHSAKKFFF